MKHLSLGLFVAYLLFISSKSFFSPVTLVELGVLVCLLIVLVGEKLYKVYTKAEYRKYLIEKAKVDIQRPIEENSEIVELRDQAEIEALKLRKYMTEQEYHKREISRAMEKEIGQGGIRF